MRILQFNVNMDKRDAIGNYMAEKIRVLRELGVEVKLCTEAENEYNEKGAYVTNYYKLKKKSVLLSARTLLIYTIKAINNPKRALEIIKRKIEKSDISSIEELQDDLNNNFDAYLFEYGGSYYGLFDLIRDVKGCKIVNFHGITPTSGWPLMLKYALNMAKKQFARNIKCADIIIVDSLFAADELVKDYGAEKSKILVHPITLQLDRFRQKKENMSVRKKYTLTKRNTLLYVGRFAPNKRIDLLIKALPLIKREMGDVTLVLVGAYNRQAYKKEHEKIVKLIKNLGVDRDVRVMGSVSDDLLVSLYQMCDVVVTASEHEFFCVPVIEAYACGKPVVASNSTVLPETVGGGGLLFEKGDEKELANQVIKLLKDRKLYAQLSNRAKKIVKSYDAKKNKKFLKGIVKKIEQYIHENRIST